MTPSPSPLNKTPLWVVGVRGVGDFSGRNGTFCGRNEEKIPRPPKAGEKILRSCAVANAPPDVAKSHGRGRFLKNFAPAALLLGLLGGQSTSPPGCSINLAIEDLLIAKFWMSL